MERFSRPGVVRVRRVAASALVGNAPGDRVTHDTPAAMLKKLSIVVLAVLLAVVVATAGLAGYVLHDPRLLKARLERAVEDSTGRAFTIAGELDIDLGPITAIWSEDVTLANAAWAQSPELVSVARLQVRVDLWRSLADGRIVLPEVRLERPRLVLERDSQGRPSWPDLAGDQKAAGDGENELPVIHALAINDGQVLYRDAMANFELDSSIESTPGKGAEWGVQQLHWRGDGSLGGSPMRFDLRIGAATDAPDRDRPLTVDGEVEVAGTSATIAGRLAAPLQLQGVALDLRLDSPDPRVLLRLAGLTGEADLPPVKIEASLARTAETWEIAELFAAAGPSDFAGRAAYHHDGAASRLRADLKSDVLDVASLRRLIAAISQSAPDAAAATTHDTGSGAQAHESLPSDMQDEREISAGLAFLRDIDAALSYRAAEVRLPGGRTKDRGAKDFGVKDLDVEADARRGIAEIDLRAGLPGGGVEGRISADLSGETPQGTIDVTARSVALRPLLEGLGLAAESATALAATIDGTFEARIRGGDLATILRRSTVDLDATIADLEAPGLGARSFELSARLGPDAASQDGQQEDGQAPLTLAADGVIGKLPLSVSLSSDAPWRLVDDDERGFPLRLAVALEELQLKASGAARRPWALDGLDIALSVEGRNPKSILAKFNLPAMELPTYRLAGNLSRDAQSWRLSGIDGRIGDSDVTGELALDLAREPALLSGALASATFDLDDLGGLVGAQPGTGAGESATEAQEASAEAADDRNQVLPDEPLKPRRWDNLDVDVELKAETVNALGLVLEGLESRVVLKEGQLVVDPLTLALSEGRVDATARLDAGELPVDTDLDVTVTRLRLGDVLRRLGIDTEAIGTISGRAKGGMVLAGEGRSLAEILGSANGEVAVMMQGGSINRFVIDALGLDFLRLFGSLFSEDGETEVRCMLVDFAVEDGLMTANYLVLDTEAAYVIGRGTIDLAEEALNLNLASDPKSANPFTGGATVQLQGSFADPEVIPSPVSVFKNIVGGLTLGVLFSPFAAAIPEITGSFDEGGDCADLIKTLRENAE